jgi:DNA polymerase-3 subunit alpha
MTAEKLYSMDEAREMFARSIHLNWDVTQYSTQQNFAEELMQILRPFCGGQCPVSIEYQSAVAKVLTQLGDKWRVRPCDELLIRLRRFLSADAVAVKYTN